MSNSARILLPVLHHTITVSYPSSITDRHLGNRSFNNCLAKICFPVSPQNSLLSLNLWNQLAIINNLHFSVSQFSERFRRIQLLQDKHPSPWTQTQRGRERKCSCVCVWLISSTVGPKGLLKVFFLWLKILHWKLFSQYYGMWNKKILNYWFF